MLVLSNIALPNSLRVALPYSIASLQQLALPMALAFDQIPLILSLLIHTPDTPFWLSFLALVLHRSADLSDRALLARTPHCPRPAVVGVRIAKLLSHSLRKRFICVGVGSVYSFEPRKIEND